jgi:hypothetical protein
MRKQEGKKKLLNATGVLILSLKKVHLTSYYHTSKTDTQQGGNTKKKKK